MNNTRLISAVSTLVIGALILLWLMLAHMHWLPGSEWPPEPEPYIELAEFIEPEDIPLPKTPGNADAPAKTEETVDVSAQVAPTSGTHFEDKGAEAEPAPVVTTPRPAPVQVAEKPKPQKTGPVKAKEPESPKPSARQTKVKDVFNRAQGHNNANNRNGDTGTAGNVNGKDNSAGAVDSKGITSGIRKGSLGGGWQWPGYGHVKSSVTGSVRLSFNVDRTGHARNIVVTGGDAPAASNSAVKRACIAEVQRRTFSRSANAGDPDEMTPATITFTFK